MAQTRSHPDLLVEAQVKRRQETGLLFAGAAILCAAVALATPWLGPAASYYPPGSLSIVFLTAGGYLNVKEIKALRGAARRAGENGAGNGRG